MADIKLFQYHEKPIRTLYIGGQIWFAAKDVFEGLDISWKGVDSLGTIKDEWTMTPEFPDTLGRKQKMLFLNEAAVYKLAFRSNKPEAERFTEWVASEVIPQIRKTGRYIPQHQGVLPLISHTNHEVQKDMSKAVNAYNFQKGGVELIVDYTVRATRALTGKTPSQLKREGKEAGLKSKDCSSGKAVMRVKYPAKASAISFVDNLHEQGYEDEKIFEVAKKAEQVFDGLIAMGVEPAELKKLKE